MDTHMNIHDGVFYSEPWTHKSMAIQHPISPKLRIKARSTVAHSHRAKCGKRSEAVTPFYRFRFLIGLEDAATTPERVRINTPCLGPFLTFVGFGTSGGYVVGSEQVSQKGSKKLTRR
jgi:hypothetical protein